MRNITIAIHGIRTFGKWQEKLQNIVEKSSSKHSNSQHYTKYNDNIVHIYKYGYFSVLAFLIPPLRLLEVRRFRKKLAIVCSGLSQYDRLNIVAHSFGTYIAAKAIRDAPKNLLPRIHTMIFAGSVLPSSFDWTPLLTDGKVTRIINDCGSSDNVLILSQLFGLFTGAAGRLGFNGFVGKEVVNRYFKGGHGLYFTSDDENNCHMSEYWVPILVTDNDVEILDQREGGIINGIVTTLIQNMEPIKMVIYAAILLTPAFIFYRFYVTAEEQRKIAEERGEALAREVARADKKTKEALQNHEIAEKNMDEAINSILALSATNAYARSSARHKDMRRFLALSDSCYDDVVNKYLTDKVGCIIRKEFPFSYLGKQLMCGVRPSNAELVRYIYQGDASSIKYGDESYCESDIEIYGLQKSIFLAMIDIWSKENDTLYLAKTRRGAGGWAEMPFNFFDEKIEGVFDKYRTQGMNGRAVIARLVDDIKTEIGSLSLNENDERDNSTYRYALKKLGSYDDSHGLTTYFDQIWRTSILITQIILFNIDIKNGEAELSHLGEFNIGKKIVRVSPPGDFIFNGYDLEEETPKRTFKRDDGMIDKLTKIMASKIIKAGLFDESTIKSMLEYEKVDSIGADIMGKAKHIGGGVDIFYFIAFQNSRYWCGTGGCQWPSVAGYIRNGKIGLFGGLSSEGGQDFSVFKYSDQKIIITCGGNLSRADNDLFLDYDDNLYKNDERLPFVRAKVGAQADWQRKYSIYEINNNSWKENEIIGMSIYDTVYYVRDLFDDYTVNGLGEKK